jgi:hypothetical protein
MRENAEIGRKRQIDTLRWDTSCLAIFNSFCELPHHSSSCLRAKHAVMWKKNVSKEVDALPVFADRNLVRMEIKMQIVLEKGLNRSKACFQFSEAIGDDHEVICVSNIVLDPECVFDELIELIEIDIGKELRSKITDRDSLPAEEAGVIGEGTPDDFTEQGNSLLILHSSTDYVEEYVMIYGSEEPVDVAFEDKAGACSVPTHTSQHRIECVYRFMRSFAFLTGERMSNECWLKNRIENGENCMV